MELGPPQKRDDGDFMQALICGQKSLVVRLIAEGADVNDLVVHFSVPMHPLEIVYRLAPESARRAIADILIDHGADIRANGGRTLSSFALMNQQDVYPLLDHVDPGSHLVLLTGLENSLILNGCIVDFLLEKHPMAESWFKRDLLLPMFLDENPISNDWVKRVEDADLSFDDGFLLKAALFSRHAKTLVPFLIEQGAPLNTHVDPPLKIAAIVGLHELIAGLQLCGGDIFADHGSALYARHLWQTEEPNTKQTSINTKIALKNAVQYEEKRAQRLLAASQTTGLDRADLLARAGKLGSIDGESTLSSLTRDDLTRLRPNNTNLSSILAGRGEYNLIFDNRIWRNDIAGAEEFFTTLRHADRRAAKPALEELRLQIKTDNVRAQLKSVKNTFKMKPS